MRFIIVFFIFLPFHISGQSTQALFSIPELSINASYTSWYGDNSPRTMAYRFMEEVQICDRNLLRFMNTHTHEDLYFLILGQKVYNFNIKECKRSLHYDFGVEKGDTIPSGTYQGFVIDSISNTELINGDIRKTINLTHPSIGYFQTEYTTVWIEGIGDMLHGLIFALAPGFEGGGSVLHCATVGEENILNDFDYSYLEIYGYTQQEILDLEENARNECFELSCIKPYIDLEVIETEDSIFIKDNSDFYDEIIWELDGVPMVMDNFKIAKENFSHCLYFFARASSECYPETIERSFIVSDQLDNQYANNIDIGLFNTLIDVKANNERMFQINLRNHPDYNISFLDSNAEVIETLSKETTKVNLCNLPDETSTIRFSHDTIPDLLFEYWLKR